MESSYLMCRQCQWEGSVDEFDWEILETCMGTDKTEICPKCGSHEVYLISH